jgi:hypothetical protein
LIVPVDADGVKEEDGGETMKLSYFKSITSNSKVYNKVLVPQNSYKSKLNL